MASNQPQGITVADYIKQNEGYDPRIYNDTKSIPTTGYGFNLKADHVRSYIPKEVLQGKRALQQKEADEIFMQLFGQAEKDARQYIGNNVFDSMSIPQKTALVDMSYNLGLTKLMKFEEMKKALLKGDFDTAAKEMLDSKYRQDVPNRALRNSKLLRSVNKEK
jgi:lysozyme